MSMNQGGGSGSPPAGGAAVQFDLLLVPGYQVILHNAPFTQEYFDH